MLGTLCMLGLRSLDLVGLRDGGAGAVGCCGGLGGGVRVAVVVVGELVDEVHVVVDC